MTILKPTEAGSTLQSFSRFWQFFIFLVALQVCQITRSDAAEKVIVFYSRQECAPCRQEKIWLDDLKIKYQEGSGDKNAGIEFYPTIIVLIDGKESFRIVGSKSREELERLLK